jgi:hypothetical protein
MSKYNIYSTREDWEMLYGAIEKAELREGVDKTLLLQDCKKSQSYDSACVLYAEATGDYSLEKLEAKKKMETEIEFLRRLRDGEYNYIGDLNEEVNKRIELLEQEERKNATRINNK